VATTGEQWVSYIKGDLKQVQAAAQQWVRDTAAREIQNQINLGNSKEYVAIVDGSRTKPVSQAEQRVVVFFVSAILARNLSKAKNVLRRAILRVSKRRTGLLSEGWVWAIQRGRRGSVTLLGSELPAKLELRPGDALILGPRANYAWYVNYFASRKQAFVPAEVRRARKGLKSRRKRPPRGFGYLAYAARQLRSELRQIGVSVWPSFSTVWPPAGRMITKYGAPMLVFRVSNRLRHMH